jgi:flavin-binding protein dodecin
MEDAMTDHVYKLTEIVGTSHDGNDAAIKAALERAQKSIRNIRWYEVVGSRGYIEEGGKVIYQVTLKVGFTLE